MIYVYRIYKNKYLKIYLNYFSCVLEVVFEVKSLLIL